MNFPFFFSENKHLFNSNQAHGIQHPFSRTKTWRTMYPAWSTYKKLLTMAMYIGFSHETLWFSVVFVNVHQRLTLRVPFGFARSVSVAGVGTAERHARGWAAASRSGQKQRGDQWMDCIATFRMVYPHNPPDINHRISNNSMDSSWFITNND